MYFVFDKVVRVYIVAINDMTNVTCLMNPETNTLRVYRDKRLLGIVSDLENDNNPSMEVFSNRDGLAYMSLNDMEIIMDNWNNMQELRKKNEKVVDKIEKL